MGRKRATKVKKARDNTAPVGRELLGRLERFTASLQETREIEKRFTCRTVQLNLRPQRYDAVLVKKTRAILQASQAVFAEFLGVSCKSVQEWEQGLKPPRGSACRLMDEIRQNPSYWIGRLRELSGVAS